MAQIFFSTNPRKTAREIRRRERNEERRGKRTSAKVGMTHFFGKLGEYRCSVRNVAKFLPAAPFVNGVRMRYEKGKLVPRVRRGGAA